MISDEIIWMLLDMKRDNENIPYSRIKSKIFLKYGETYEEKTLEKVFWKYDKDPKFKPKEIKKPYIDLA